MENDNDYTKYCPVGVCGYLKDEYGKLFKNGHWSDLTNIPWSLGITATSQRADNNGYPSLADGHKCYECGGNNLSPEVYSLQHENSRGHCGLVGYGRYGHGHGRVNDDCGGVHNGYSSNITRDRLDGNLKPVEDWKYIHIIDENAFLILLLQPGSYEKRVSALLWASMGFIITTSLPLKNVTMPSKRTVLSPNLTTP